MVCWYVYISMILHASTSCKHPEGILPVWLGLALLDAASWWRAAGPAGCNFQSHLLPFAQSCCALQRIQIMASLGMAGQTPDVQYQHAARARLAVSVPATMHRIIAGNAICHLPDSTATMCSSLLGPPVRIAATTVSLVPTADKHYSIAAELVSRVEVTTVPSTRV